MLKIVQHKNIFVGIALLLVVASIVSLLVLGFELDTDFAGGTAITYTFDKKVEQGEIEKMTTDAFGRKPSMIRVTQNGKNYVVDIEVGYDTKLSDDENVNNANNSVNELTYKIAEKWGKVVAVVDENGAAMDYKSAINMIGKTEAAATENGGEGKLYSTIKDSKSVISYGDMGYYIEGVHKSELNIVSPSTARNLAKSAILMSLLAALGILIYVAIRFDFTSGVCAVAALTHDIVVLCGIYSIFRIKIDTNFIAALLTVLGYSINNTIVIFDRIRENNKRKHMGSYSELANVSVNQTIKRSINTTVTTLLTIGMVYILGVESIKAFALPIIIGIAVGTYSSIFVSGSIWATWKDASVNNKKAQTKKK